MTRVSTPTSHSRRRVALAAAAGLALLAACADDGSDSRATTTANTAPTVPAPTSTEVPSTSAPAGTDSTVAPTTDAPASTAPLTADSVRLEAVAAGFDRPVDIAWRAGDARLYVVSQTGLVIPVTDGVAGAPVLDIRQMVSTSTEQGLLGLAFHPTEAFAYVDYTDTEGDTAVAEYAVGTDGVFDPGSARVVLTVNQPYENHNGGDLAFGPDGMLYIALGDGGAAADPERNSLNTGVLLGKLLRIDPRPAGTASYGIPADNPFVGVDGARGEVWSYGLRNPWRFSFDPTTGDLWIGDVGQGDWEEIDVARDDVIGAGGGVNFGWSAWEGTHRYNDDQAPEGATAPVYEYPHGEDGCSVTGGVVYRGAGVPSLAGWYLFADWCSGKLFALPATSEPGGDMAAIPVLTLAQPGPISAIGTDPNGEVLVLGHADGTVYRVVAA